MIKLYIWAILGLCIYVPDVWAQSANLNEAKYITTLKVIVDHKMHDKNLEKDIDKLRESKKFQDDLRKMLDKLDNNRPNNAVNIRIKRILENTGKQIYNELK